MATKTIKTYDGIAYKEIIGEEILINNKPTGHYRQIEEKQITVYGCFLDSENNQIQLKKDIEELRTFGTFYANNAILTDGKNFSSYMLNFVGDYTTKTKVNNWYEWVMEIILKLGYVNEKYNYDAINKTIKFLITPKSKNDSPFVLTLSIIDHNSYVLK